MVVASLARNVTFRDEDSSRRIRANQRDRVYTRTASAPRSTSCRTQVGPLRAVVRSMTVMPAKGPRFSGWFVVDVSFVMNRQPRTIEVETKNVASRLNPKGTTL